TGPAPVQLTPGLSQGALQPGHMLVGSPQLRWRRTPEVPRQAGTTGAYNPRAEFRARGPAVSERFFVSAALRPGPVELDGPEGHHLAAVCRVRRGDVVSLFNGDGREYRARVAEVSKRSVNLEVEAVDAPARELSFRLEVA